MAEESKSKKDKPKSKPDAQASGKAPKKDKAAKSDKGDKKEKEAPVAAEAPKPPRPPADPRMKFIKKFQGRFLPKGPLRDRHKQIIERWNSGEDHGGVTVEELKSLYTDWRGSKTATKAKAAV